MRRFLGPTGKSSKYVFAITLLNLFVFLAWNFSDVSEVSFMAKNFLVSWTSLSQWRWWTLLTSVFSHFNFLHFFINMYVLNNFGPLLESLLGHRAFLKFYLTAGVFSSLCHVMVSAWVIGRPDQQALGASGAISGLVVLFSFLFPKQKLLLFGLIPVPALFGALVFIGLDLWGLIEQAEGGGLPIGHGAHLGGAIAGILYFFILRRALKKNQQTVFESELE